MLQAHVRDALRDRFSSKISDTALRSLIAGVLEDEDLKGMLQGAAQLRADLLAGVQPWHEITPNAVLEWVKHLFDALDPEAFDTTLDALPHLMERGIELAAAQFLKRNAAGREDRIARVLHGLRPRLAELLVRILKEVDTDRARKVLAELPDGPSVALRLIASAHLEELDDARRAEVVEMLGHADPEIRWAALKASEAHALPAAAELAERKINSRQFHALDRDERELLIGVVEAIDPLRGEKIAIEMVAQHGVIGEQSVNESRILAARLLQAKSSAQAALTALRGASTPLWWNPPAVRQAASAAISTIQARRDATAKQGKAS
jgi:hypothetical protein